MKTQTLRDKKLSDIDRLVKEKYSYFDEKSLFIEANFLFNKIKNERCDVLAHHNNATSYCACLRLLRYKGFNCLHEIEEDFLNEWD